MRSKDWLTRQKRDFFVKNAKKDGYVSRAAYKLKEIENKFKIISNSKYILELGSSPGGWSQVVIETNNNAKLCAFDILDMKFMHQNIKFYQKDFLKFDYSILPYKFDLILSDIAPNTTGHQSTDHLRISSMIEDIINILDKVINIDGYFIFKIWKGKDELLIINKLKEKFQKISYFKPKSTRNESSEIFIVAEKFIN